MLSNEALKMPDLPNNAIPDALEIPSARKESEGEAAGAAAGGGGATAEEKTAAGGSAEVSKGAEEGKADAEV